MKKLTIDCEWPDAITWYQDKRTFNLKGLEIDFIKLLCTNNKGHLSEVEAAAWLLGAVLVTQTKPFLQVFPHQYAATNKRVMSTI